jgi:hypothetical protein
MCRGVRAVIPFDDEAADFVVSPRRIGGIWSPRISARWDFRRRLTDAN